MAILNTYKKLSAVAGDLDDLAIHYENEAIHYEQHAKSGKCGAVKATEALADEYEARSKVLEGAAELVHKLLEGNPDEISRAARMLESHGLCR